MTKLVKTVPKTDLYIEFIQALNGILDLTEREAGLFAEIIKLDLAYKPAPNGTKNVVCTSNRRLLIKKLGISRDNLSRYITRFKKKQLLVTTKHDGELIVNKSLLPEIVGDRVQITIILKTNKDANSTI